jgi:nucleoside-triphosphatase THEP1
MLYLLTVIMIMTGPVRSGKTSYLAGVATDLTRRRIGASGFLSPAAFEGGRQIGYDLSVLGRETPIPYIRAAGEPGWERVGPYYFIPEALEVARREIRESRERDLLIVDELGPLELAGGGLWGVLEPVLSGAARRCLLVVRESCLRDLLDKIGGQRVRVFQLGGAADRASLMLEITGLPRNRHLKQAGKAEERSGRHVG